MSETRAFAPTGSSAAGFTLPGLIAAHPAWTILLAALLVAAYAPVYARMIGDWWSDPNYSHGFLVPLVCAWFVHEAMPGLRAEPARPTGAGFVLVAAGLLLLAAGTLSEELYSRRLSSLALLAGIIHTLAGGRVLRLLAPPLAFALLMIPLPYTIYDALALPLKHMVSVLATAGMKLTGLPVLREGNMILLPNISLEVAEACSGLRSLMSLIALGAAYAFIFLKGPWRRAALIAATIPIAIFANTLRVFVTGILARHFGAVVAEGFFHSFAGLAVFVTAMVLTALLGAALGGPPRRRARRPLREKKGGGHAP